MTYGEAGAVRQAMPPTTKTFAATQSHWFRLADGKVIEHWANRDDLAMAEQLRMDYPQKTTLTAQMTGCPLTRQAPPARNRMPPS